MLELHVMLKSVIGHLTQPDLSLASCCLKTFSSDFTFLITLVQRTSLKGLGCWSPGLLLPLASGVCLPNGIPASERKLLVTRLQEHNC